MSDSPDYTKDTIVAIATPPGKGGIGIVRLSGAESEIIARKILPGVPRPRIATRTEFSDSVGQPIDSGIALWFPAPDSYTGESVLELQGHGGPVVMSLLMQAAIDLGARRAEPGEFSQRAFLNGKLDLVQAEAIVDLIDSGTAQAARAAHRSLSGAFSHEVDTLAETLTRLRLHVEAAIDFPEEEIDFLADGALRERLESCEKLFADIQARASAGRVLKDGVRAVIVGKPNAGKSSLLNLLSDQDAAIVTEYAGTTRDILREQIDINGLAVELVDTAGIREDPDAVEAEGIRRAKKALENADLVLWIQDTTDADSQLPEGTELPDVPTIVLRNKVDLSGEEPGTITGSPVMLNISATTGAGINELKRAICDIAGYADQGEGAFTSRQRHIDALAAAASHFRRGKQALESERAGELLAEELRLAQEALSALTGGLSSDDLLGRIFTEFCIGK